MLPLSSNDQGVEEISKDLSLRKAVGNSESMYARISSMRSVLKNEISKGTMSDIDFQHIKCKNTDVKTVFLSENQVSIISRAAMITLTIASL